MQVEKTVFISYRRTNAMTARAVYQHLKAHDYDCFLDYESIDAGFFGQIILNQIAARAHFIVILTPSAMERCAEPGDWLRREIEFALDNGRNIVPLMFDGFRYSDVQKYLIGKLNVLPQYNSLEIPSAYFDEAMTRLENRFLNKPLNVILRPTPAGDKRAVADLKANIELQSTVTERQLSAEEWFERGLKRVDHDYDGKVADYSEAIRLSPKYAEAFNNRGIVHKAKGNLDGAIADFTRSIELKNPELHLPYFNRGSAFFNKKDYDGAILDYSEAIRLNPNYAKAYYGRGLSYRIKQNFDGAIADYSEAIRLNPKYAEAYNNRGNARKAINDYDGAIADYSEAIRLNPKDIKMHTIYNSRGMAFHTKGDYDRAIADYEAALKIDPIFLFAKQNLENARRDQFKRR